MCCHSLCCFCCINVGFLDKKSPRNVEFDIISSHGASAVKSTISGCSIRRLEWQTWKIEQQMNDEWWMVRLLWYNWHSETLLLHCCIFLCFQFVRINALGVSEWQQRQSVLLRHSDYHFFTSLAHRCWFKIMHGSDSVVLQHCSMSHQPLLQANWLIKHNNSWIPSDNVWFFGDSCVFLICVFVCWL